MTAVSLGEARALWRRARTFEDLCALGARFVTGELPHFPGWGATALDRESDPHVDDLAALNRAGFLTVASQPGRGDAEAPGEAAPGEAFIQEALVQRAFVCGFASGATSARIVRGTRASDLVVAVFHPGEGGGRREPVSLRGGEPCAFAGHAAFDAELPCFAEHLGPEGRAALAGACWVSAYDQVWGRDTALWDGLCRTLRAGGA